MRRIGVTLLLLALFVAALAVLQRGMEIRSDPDAGLIDPFKGITVPERPPRERPAERPATPPPRSVRVSVTSMDGTPIPGARVELVAGPEDVSRRGFIPQAAPPPRGRTVGAEEDGVAIVEDVPSGRWFVVAEAPGFARHALAGVVRGDDDAGVDTTVALEKGHAFAGTIRDPDGTPAAGIAVVLVPRTTFVSDATCLRATTSKDGSYRFESVETGAHDLWYAPHADVCVEEASVLVPQLDGLDIRMSRGATIEGTVRDADLGGPVAGARVVALEFVESRISGVEGRTTVLDRGRTDRMGRFALRTWRRTCELTLLVVEADGYAPFPVEDSGECPPAPLADGQRFAFDLRVRRAGTLVGTVKAPGVDVAGLVVFARSDDCDVTPFPGARPWTCAVGADGRFRIDGLQAGAVEVGVREPETRFPLASGLETEVVSARETTQDIEFEVRHVRISRLVVDENGEPVPDVEVTECFGRFRASAKSDTDGRVSIDAVFPGAAPIIPLLLRRLGFRERWVLAGADDGEDPFPPLRRGEDVQGTLTRNGSPAAGARLQLIAGIEGMHGQSSSHWSGTRETVTAGDGTFRLPFVGGPDHWFETRHVAGFEGAGGQYDDLPEEPIGIELPDTSRITGLVVAGDAPASGARICAFDSLVVAQTRADGQFDVSLSSTLDGQLFASADGWLRSHQISWNSGEARVELDRAVSLAGVVRGADGNPVPHLRVEVRWPDASVAKRLPDFTSASDADGRFVVHDVEEGALDVSVVDPLRHRFTSPRVRAMSGGATVEVNVRAAARLVVRVTDADGELIFADVSAHAESADLADVTESTYPHAEAAFGLATEVAYTIRAVRDGYEPAERRDVRAGADAITIVLQRKDDK